MVNNFNLPNDHIAEKALIGAMLIDNSYVGEVFSELSPDDFYRDAHKIIANAINQIVNVENKAADSITLGNFLESQGNLKFVGGYIFINQLLDGVHENIEINEYIDIVKNKATLRKIIEISNYTLNSSIAQSADTKSILEELQKKTSTLIDDEIKDGLRPTIELVKPTVELVGKIQNHGDGDGVKSRFYDLDKITGGFQKSDLIIIAARPSMGKTALGLNFAANMAIKERKKIAFFSIEMSSTQIIMRLLASHAGVSMSSLRTGLPKLSNQEWSNIHLAASELKNSSIYIDDSSTLSTVEIASRARKMKNDIGVDIIFVDYLQLVKVSSGNLKRNDSRVQEVAFISSSLKAMAKELNVPVVALAQLNRSPEQRNNKGDSAKYQLSDLKESGAIEQDADMIMFLHRDEMVNQETERKGEADIIIAKHRSGPTGKIVLGYISQHTKFCNIEYDYSEESII